MQINTKQKRLPISYYFKLEKNEMGGAYIWYGGEERRVEGFRGET